MIRHERSRRRKSVTSSSAVSQRWGHVELLEHRCLLAGDTLPVGVQGTVRLDIDRDGQVAADEVLSDATIELWSDNGDGQFGVGTDVLQATAQTGADGSYQFTSVSPAMKYFVRQPPQQGTGGSVPEQLSGLIDLTSPAAAQSQPAPQPASSSGSGGRSDYQYGRRQLDHCRRLERDSRRRT